MYSVVIPRVFINRVKEHQGKMIKTQQIKIEPNKHMIKIINSLFNYRRYCWNQSLNTWNDMYEGSIILEDKSLRPNNNKTTFERPTKITRRQYTGPMTHFKDHFGKLDLLVTPEYELSISQVDKQGEVKGRNVLASKISKKGNYNQKH